MPDALPDRVKEMILDTWPQLAPGIKRRVRFKKVADDWVLWLQPEPETAEGSVAIIPEWGQNWFFISRADFHNLAEGVSALYQVEVLDAPKKSEQAFRELLQAYARKDFLPIQSEHLPVTVGPYFIADPVGFIADAAFNEVSARLRPASDGPIYDTNSLLETGRPVGQPGNYLIEIRGDQGPPGVSRVIDLLIHYCFPILEKEINWDVLPHTFGMYHIARPLRLIRLTARHDISMRLIRPDHLGGYETKRVLALGEEEPAVHTLSDYAF